MDSTEKKLLAGFRDLDPGQQASVLDFVDFLGSRSEAQAPREIAQPIDIPRPEKESVIKAVKRLRATYPMLEPGKLLHDTSNQMTRHMVHGVAAVEVIDELERLFRGHYETLLAQRASK